jgi:predicted PurR-regulated permease PerM
MNRFYLMVLLVGLLFFGWLNYRIFEPFFIPIGWAFVLAVTFFPLYALVRRKLKNSSLSSFLVVALILLMIIGPFSYLSFLLVQELKSLLDFLGSGKLDFLLKNIQSARLEEMINKIVSWFHIPTAEVHRTFSEGVSKIGKELIGGISSGLGGIVTAAFHFIIMSFTLFFFFTDGPVLLQKARDFLPFPEEQKNILARRVQDIIISTIYGGVIVALAQGTVGGVAFYLVGIESPVLWGLAMALCSFLPVFGTGIVWVPAVIYLLAQGAIAKGIALLLMGALGISTIDNFLRPMIIRNRMRMPFIVLFFTILGGIKVFGLIGIVMGPMVLVVFISLIDIFRRMDPGQGNSPAKIEK